MKMMQAEYNWTKNIKKDETKKVKHNINPFSTTKHCTCMHTLSYVPFCTSAVNQNYRWRSCRGHTQGPFLCEPALCGHCTHSSIPSQCCTEGRPIFVPPTTTTTSFSHPSYFTGECAVVLGSAAAPCCACTSIGTGAGAGGSVGVVVPLR